MKETIPQKKLDFWISHNYNVLLEGNHGVGKTSAIFQALHRHNLRYQYFSCATLDPWVDFVGIPKEQFDNDRQIAYLDLVRPKFFAFDEIDVIVLDEMNRAPPKVMNALMELIQFKSINGKKLNNLKMIFAAINPPATKDKDPQYHVQELDPAVRSRFHVKYTVPFKIAETYFEEKYGKKITSNITEWWDSLPKDIQLQFPPREIDHALQMLNDGGDINDTLPNCIKKSTFIKVVQDEKEALPIVKTKPTSSGISQNVNFVNASIADLTRESLDKAAFSKKLRALSNEEFVHLFKRVGKTSAAFNPTVSAVGQRMIDYGTNDQVKAAALIDYMSEPNSFTNHLNRMLARNATARKISIMRAWDLSDDDITIKAQSWTTPSPKEIDALWDMMGEEENNDDDDSAFIKMPKLRDNVNKLK